MSCATRRACGDSNVRDGCEASSDVQSHCVALKTRASKSPSLVWRVTPCGWRSRRRTPFQSEKSRKRSPSPPLVGRGSARARRFERAQRLRDLVRRLKLPSRIENACFEGGVARTCDTRALWNGAFLLAGEFLRSAVESNSQRLLSNRSRARKRRRICCLDTILMICS